MDSIEEGRGARRLVSAAWIIVAAGAFISIVAAAAVVLGGDKRPTGPDMRRLPVETRQAYSHAVEHRDLFRHLPCYCGCAVLATPHENLADCFLAGSEYATHASSCQVCVDIALEAEQARSEGLDHKQIRDRIDERFAGRGPRTPTGGP